MSFGIALSGIDAAQSELDVTANNIANSETTGFKQSRSEFADLFAVSQQGVSTTQAGNGVKLASVAQQFSQGNIESTGNSLDLAISGSGFFVLSDNGTKVYTRAGEFTTDADNYVVNEAGDRLQVYPVTTAGNFNTSTTTDLQLITSDSAPNATTTANAIFNLPSSADVPATSTFDPTDATSYNKSTSVTVYDSLGAAHTASMYFVKEPTANTWDSYLTIDGTQINTTPQVLTYSSGGVLTSPTGGGVDFGNYTPSTGANDMDIGFNFASSTQYGSTFSVNSITQDGYTTGTLTGISVDSTGVVQARFTNGRSISLGQVAMSTFANPQGLQKLGDTSWGETFASGQPLNATAGSSGFGLFQSGSLEKSNVDITAQLVNMITAQRFFQSNAQVISTEDQITQTIINIR
ncbi:MAG TPA: flagellar hook protein FlgE [Steroidobacteraceae bacterium]|nr:flagellar hook protein FlgE [Steroidobacteraceae bacterium]